MTEMVVVVEFTRIVTIGPASFAAFEFATFA